MQKILVVDDMEINRMILHMILEDTYNIEVAANGKQALQKLLENE